MSKIRLNTTIEEELLLLIKEKVLEYGIKNINVILERALKFYFANLNVSVWEAKCSGGWTRKLIIRPDVLIVENIRSRKCFKNYERAYYSNDELLENEGWKRVWRMNTP